MMTTPLNRFFNRAQTAPMDKGTVAPFGPAFNPLLQAARRVLDGRQALYRQLTERFQQRSRLDLQRWRQALLAAERPDAPNRRPLLELYHEILLDAHLTSVLGTRRLRLQGATCALYNAKGEADPAATRILKEGWFTALVGHIVDSLYYGHSLIELVEADNGRLEAVLIPRPNVEPELGLLTLDGNAPVSVAGAESSLPWLTLAELPYALVATGSGLGLLNQAVPLVLMKKNALACWSEFAEVFGMPLRIGRTPARDERRKQQLANVLRQMGSATYAVLEEGEQIEFQANAKGDAFQVYSQLINTTNQELSKLVSGQTLTTEAGDHGARALGEIHKNIFDEITRSDARLVEGVVTAQVLPLLARFADYAQYAEGYTFGYDLEATELSLKEQWQIDQGLLAHFVINPDYFREKYGVPITGLR